MTESDKRALELLEALNFEVKVIPKAGNDGTKSADFLVSYLGVIAILEAKLKEDSLEVISQKETELSERNVSIVEGKLGRNETMSGVIHKAKTQLLSSSSDKEHDFKIISFIATGCNTKTKADQFKDTIYGSTSIISFNEKPAGNKTCYFYRYSDFYRHKMIDAAIVAYDTSQGMSVTLCLNPYSENYEKLKESPFITPFNGAVIDPIELEKQECAYIPDTNIDLKKDNVLNHLREKYDNKTFRQVDFNAPEYTFCFDR